MLKLFNYELSFRRETTGWAGEEIHVWEYIFRIEKLTPAELAHRMFLKTEGDWMEPFPDIDRG